MILTPHFDLAEMTRTATGLRNEPDLAEFERLYLVALHLEAIRSEHGPLRVTSGFRSAEVNAVVFGASPQSAHVFGCAADFVPLVPPPAREQACRELWRWLPGSGLRYDQAILELRPPPEGAKLPIVWVHFGLARPGTRARREHFTIDKR